MSEAKPNGGPRTLVEEGTHLKGSLSSTCPIDVKGRVDGELTAPSLTVSASGAVHGKVKVADLLSEGEISGEVDADVVRLSGVVKDNTVLRAKSLEVKLASAKGKVQVTFGECVLEVGEAPTRDAETGKKDEAAKAAPADAAPRSVPPPNPTPSAPPPPMS
jgi:cytoskeletal protein CcmA (bactofilin family)